MTYRLFPPGARKGNRFWLVRGVLNGRRYEFSARTLIEANARDLADCFEAGLYQEQRQEAANAQRALDEQNPPTGYVYFVGADDGRVKIGYSVNPPGRLKALRTGASSPLRLLAEIPGRIEDEMQLHIRFAVYRIHHEWFRFEGELRAYVMGLARG